MGKRGRAARIIDNPGHSDGPPTSGPDCAGCYAPCCRFIRFFDPLDQVRPMWKAAGAHLVRIVPGADVFHCDALSAAGCTVYEKRPEPCRRFDCRPFVEAGELFVPENPSCPLPGR